jgi:hypothetical protein
VVTDSTSGETNLFDLAVERKAPEVRPSSNGTDYDRLPYRPGVATLQR